MTDTENTPNTEAEVTAELAKPEDVTAYVEERHEQEADALPPEDETAAIAREMGDKHPELKEAKKASRYERLKRARDQFKAEAEELRQKYEPRDAELTAPASSPQSDVDTGPLERSLEAAQHMYGSAFDSAYRAFVEHCQRTGDKAAYEQVMSAGDVGQALVQWHDQMGNPTPSPQSLEAEVQRGRQEQQAVSEREAAIAEIRVQEGARIRAETFAAQCSDFVETIQSIEGLADDVPPLMIDLMRRSNVGPEMVYLMAKDYWSPNSMNILDQARETTDPISQARFVGALEQAVLTSRSKGGLTVPAQGRATKAPPPLSQVRGGANAPRDIHSLAKSDDASDYIRARRSAS